MESNVFDRIEPVTRHAENCHLFGQADKLTQIANLYAQLGCDVTADDAALDVLDTLTDKEISSPVEQERMCRIRDEKDPNQFWYYRTDTVDIAKLTFCWRNRMNSVSPHYLSPKNHSPLERLLRNRSQLVTNLFMTDLLGWPITCRGCIGLLLQLRPNRFKLNDPIDEYITTGNLFWHMIIENQFDKISLFLDENGTREKILRHGIMDEHRKQKLQKVIEAYDDQRATHGGRSGQK